jgi:hypothetical protein
MNELQEIKANIAKIDKQYRISKGYAEDCNSPTPAEQEDTMYQMLGSVYSYIDRIQSQMYSWQDSHCSNYTHLPKLTPSQTENLLKAAGANKDFEVQKKIIWASTNNQGHKQFLVDLNIK